MRYPTVVAGLGLAFLLATASHTALADDRDSGHMLSLLDLSVKAGHEHHFREGIAAWKDCYLEHEGELNWTVWRRMHGKGVSYTATFYMDGWADLDDADPTMDDCADIAREQITGYSESAHSAYLRFLPDWSRSSGSPEVIEVMGIGVSDERPFRAAVESMTESMRNVEGDTRAFWYKVLGGDAKDPDYVAVIAHENFASLDARRDSVLDVVGKDKGEEAAERLGEELRESAKILSTYIYRRMDDLSHPPED